MITEAKDVTTKIKKRGFVMTGGGAKGLYEAGVIHAFHLCSMEFDVITGSSVGAMNSIFFAEYLYKKAELIEKGVQRKDSNEHESEAIIRELTPLVNAYHHAWLMMPSQKIVDDSENGPFGKLRNQLVQYSVGLPLLVNGAWWWTDPDRTLLPPSNLIQDLTKLIGEVFPTLGQAVLMSLKEGRPLSWGQIARSYFKNINAEKSLVPRSNNGLKNLFTEPVKPLVEENLRGDVVGSLNDVDTQGLRLINPTRTLRDFADRDIIVRLTRANFRTGRLEISQYVKPEDFVRFLMKYKWLKDAEGPSKIPLGSFRLQVPGNPNAVDAALCSGRFPGVFEPFAVEDVYHPYDSGNALLHQMLAYWINDRDVYQELRAAYSTVTGITDETALDISFKDLLSNWRDRDGIGGYFPKSGDVYVDGGTIDNTPSNSAVDYVREWVDRQDSHVCRSDVKLELYVIYLSPEPKIDIVKERDPAIFEVVNRTVKIQGIAKNTADGNTVSIINTFGGRAEALAQTLKVVLKNYQETLQEMTEEEKCRALDSLMQSATAIHLQDLDGLGTKFNDDTNGLLDRLSEWNDDMLRRKLPVEVEAVTIFPEEMPLDTLQFTERLGYKKENAIKMLVSGCYDSIWSIREHLESAHQPLDKQDEESLYLARKWMGNVEWPDSKDLKGMSHLRKTWKCQNGENCVFYKHYCPHGAPSLLKTVFDSDR